jgi:uroporphyrin-III C-methyltransferase
VNAPARSTEPARREGRVIFVGAGPGSADLITVRGSRALAAADVVLFDALTDDSLREAAPGARWINVGKRGYDHGTAQAHINALMVAHARRGLTVVRLKGGDPSIFGRLEEELEALQADGIACEVVPGVTAALAAAAQTLRPLTRRGRGRSVSLSTAVTRDASVDALDSGDPAPANGAAPRADTDVLYMAGQQLAHLPRRLAHAGWAGDTPASVVSRAGTPDMIFSQHTVASLDEAALLHRGRPTVVTVGVGATAIGAADAVSSAASRTAAALSAPSAPSAPSSRAGAPTRVPELLDAAARQPLAPPAAAPAGRAAPAKLTA